MTTLPETRLDERVALFEAIARRKGAPFVEIEPTTRCNAECLMCPREALGRPLGNMEPRVFEKALERIAEARLPFPVVNFCGFGDPLLHPRIFEMLAAARAALGPSAQLLVTTNGSTLRGARIDRLLDSGVGAVAVSFNGITAATYERIMRPLRFHDVLANVEETARRNAGRVVLTVVGVRNKLAAEEVPAYANFWRQRGVDRVVLWDAHNRGGNFEDAGFYEQRPAAPRGCDVFRYWNCVGFDGTYLPCDMDLSTGRQYALGDVFTRDFAGLTQVKRVLAVDGPSFPMCAGCDHPHRQSLLRSYVQEGML